MFVCPFCKNFLKRDWYIYIKEIMFASRSCEWKKDLALKTVADKVL